MLSLLITFALSCPTEDQWPPATWTQPTDPFHVVGPVYYVGGRELTAYLVVDDAGLILVNIGMEANVPMVLKSIRDLGFDPQKLRYLLITQAHMDHAGGAALIQKQTGAEVLAGNADLPLLKKGGLEDHVFGDDLPFAPVKNPRGLINNESVSVGKTTLKTIATPGHTPGSSSWLLTIKGENEETRVLFQGSISVLADANLKDNASYPDVVKDFQTSFQRLEAIKADYILPDHLVFVHPKGMNHKDPVDVLWFQREDVLTRQLNRSKRMLKQMTQ